MHADEGWSGGREGEAREAHDATPAVGVTCSLEDARLIERVDAHAGRQEQGSKAFTQLT